jgi:hypothetical protein
MTVTDRWNDRILSVFRGSPHVEKTRDTLLAPLADTEDVMGHILARTSLDDKTGFELDLAGWVIGVIRPPAQESDLNLLWLCDLDEMDTDPDNNRGLGDLEQTEGGYMTGLDGIVSQTDPGSYMADDDYRELIKTKAATFRRRATLENLFTYLSRFGIRADIGEAVGEVIFTPDSFDAVNYFKRDYIETKGFRPAGIRIRFAEQTESEAGL